MKQLTQEQIKEIQRATEDVLGRIGVQVMHAGLLARARAAGADVDEANGTVRLAAPLLRELLAQAPSQYEIADAHGHTFTVGRNSLGCLAIVTDPWIIDYDTQRPRRPCLADLRRHSIIAQKLAPVVGASRMDFPVSDVKGPTSSLRALEEHLLHFSKHMTVLPASLESFEQWLEIGRILIQGRDLIGSRLITLGVPVLSPLRLTEMNAELLLRACAYDFPVVSTICPMAGTTGPYNKIGTLLLGNAENVFLAAMCQIVRPGQPYLYALGPSRTDMLSGGDQYYTLDKVLWKLAAAQMGHAYHLPVSSECGGTMTYRYDQQNGAEGLLFMLAAYESQAGILAGIGSCYNANGMSAEMMLIHTAWLEAARFLGRGLETDGLDEALESIRRAGPGGHYLADDLTLKNLRSDEFFHSALFDHSGHYGPHPSLLERAHEQVEALVAGFESPLPGQVQEELRRTFSDLYRRLG
ncbi:MAG: trimethylamine methyltransferase family protein [Chloroflexota bacterium]